MPLASLCCALSMMASGGGAADALAAQRADLAFVRSEYVQASAAFDAASRAAALTRIAHLEARASALPPAAFLIELMRISASAGNGHDYFDTGRGWFPARRLPLRLLWLADGLVIARAAPAQAALVGAEVLAIDGHDPAQIMQVLQTLDGSQPGYLRGNKSWLLESPELLQAAGIARRADRVRLRLRDADGRVFERVVAAVPSAQVPLDGGRFGAWLAAASAQESARGWTNARQSADEPLYLQAPERMFRIVDLAEADALYLQLRGNLDAADESLGDFAARALQALQATPRRHLVLDQRFNYGGNSDPTLELMRAIGGWTRGRVFVLTSGSTFSAGIVSVAQVKQQADGRATIVGEPVGDRLRWWSEGHAACLPHSGYCLHASTGLWDLRDGCGGEAGCYGDRFGIRVDDLDPDLAVALTRADWRAGRDPLLAAVLRTLGH